MSTRITRFTARNFQGLKAIDITPPPDTHRVVLAGRNRQGKSSAFEALRAVLFGKKSFSRAPIRTGASQAESTVELDNGMKLELVISQGGHKFRVTQNGKRPEGTPAAILKSLVNDICADPMKLANMEERELVEQILKLSGLDTSDLELAIKQAYDARTEVNREVKSLEARFQALPQKHADVPEEEVSIKQLLADKATAEDVQSVNDDAREELEKLRKSCRETYDSILELDKQMEELEKQRVELVKKRSQQNHDCELAAQSVARIIDPDIDSINTRLESAEETNKKVRENKARAQLAKDLEQKRMDSCALTQLIEDTEEQKKERIASCKMPVPGLSFDGGQLFLDGVPFSQASHSQKMVLCVGIAALINPELAVLLVEEGYACDEETLQSLYDIARKHEPPLDIWLETLNKQPGAFVIEAGEVAEIVPEDE